MKKFMNQTFRMLAFGLVSASMVLSSCDDDEDPTTSADPTISVTSATSQQMPGGKVTFTIAVAAEGGLTSIKQGDAEVKAYSTESLADVLTYEFTIPASQALGSLVVPFTVTDKQAKTTSASATITVTANPKETIVVEAPISANTTWRESKFYLLKGNVYVEDGAELTIEPGTIILGDKVTKGALIVSRGGKIHAQGTEAQPIIFTSSAPMNFRNYGDWGGVVLLGNGQNNQSESQKIEGISAADGDNGLYGGDGSMDDESSGEFYYVRIEFAGIALSTDNELNGLTFGGVGSGTEVHHVQVSFSGDDSYEWFGGAVNTQYLVAYRGWDDEFDTDFGHHGTHQYIVSFRDPNIADKSGSNGFESDNNAGGDGLTPITAPRFSNVTFFGPFVYASLKSGNLEAGNINGNYKRGAHIRRNSALQVYNSAWVGANIDGFLFETTNANAVVKGNYIGRITGNPNAELNLKASNPYDMSAFATDNIIESPKNKVDISALFDGLSGLGDIAAPSAQLAAGSALLSAGVEVPEGLEQTDYVGAFDGTNNWMTGWTNFNPNGTNYGN